MGEYKHKGNLGGVECGLADDPETYREVSLEELLGFDDCSLTCESGDWQFYFVQTGETTNDGYFVKIKKSAVLKAFGR